MAKKNTVPEIIEKEVETVSVFDRHTLNWFIDEKNNELRIGKSLSDFLNKETENFQVKTIHLCDEKYWKLAETTDKKFVLLNRNKLLK
jgi:ferritin